MGNYSQKKFKEQKNFFITYDNLWTLDKTNPTRGPNHFLHCFFVQRWKRPLQEWTCFNEIIVQQGKSEGFESCDRPIVRKRPIWVKIGDVLSRVTLKFDIDLGKQ